VVQRKLVHKRWWENRLWQLNGFHPARGPSLSSAVVVLSNLAKGVVNGKDTSVKSYVFNQIISFVNGVKDGEPIEALEMDV
jgi:hypothetical protein